MMTKKRSHWQYYTQRINLKVSNLYFSSFVFTCTFTHVVYIWNTLNGCTYTPRLIPPSHRSGRERRKLDARGSEFKIIKTARGKDKSRLPTHQAARWCKGRKKEGSERVRVRSKATKVEGGGGRGGGQGENWLGKRFDRRAKKNTGLIKVKYALPAMWVIILDLCINPFFPSSCSRMNHPHDEPHPAVHRVLLTLSGFSYPSNIAEDSPPDSTILPLPRLPAFLLSSALTWIRFPVYFQTGVSSSFQTYVYERVRARARLNPSISGIIMKP